MTWKLAAHFHIHYPRGNDIPSPLVDSRKDIGWAGVLEQTRVDNHASVSMIKRCGLQEAKDTVSVVVNRTGGHIKR